MSDENEKKKQKKKALSVLGQNSQILQSLSSAVEIQMALSQSALSSIAKMANSSVMQQALRAMTAVSATQEMIIKMANEQASLLQTLQASPIIRAVAEYQKITKRLAEMYSEIYRMTNFASIDVIKKPILPKISANIDEIPSQTNKSVQSLLNYISILERELAREKEENKELRRILADRRKELEKYVA